MTALTTISMIGIGATIGASLRYYLGITLTSLLGVNFPYGTLAANVLGSFVAGVLLLVILEKSLLSETYRLILLVGLCGSLTTFSTVSLETLQLINAQNYAQAGFNTALNVVCSLLAVWLGFLLAKNIF